jgi:quercetin dioxygenase-like cupin family protein
MASTNSLPVVFQDQIQSIVTNKIADRDVVISLYEYIKRQYYEENPDFITSNWNWGTREINGTALEGRLLPLQDETRVIDEVIGEKRLTVSLGTRKAGTRVGIHVHEAGGLTFVVGGDGAITDYVEGIENTFNQVGDYYFMPYNTTMSAANLGSEDVVLLDIFFIPIDKTPLTITEEGYPSYDPPSYFYTSIFLEPKDAKQKINDSILDGRQKQFEVLGGPKNLRSIDVSFSEVEDNSKVSLDRETAGGGTIKSNSPLPMQQTTEYNLDGIYFNSDAGNDCIIGSKMNDFIRGGAGSDKIDGLAGDDIIRGGSGGDLMRGGEGSDQFYFTPDQIDDAIDFISDFDKSEDKIVIQSGIEIIADNESLFLGYKDFELEVRVDVQLSLADILINEI